MNSRKYRFLLAVVALVMFLAGCSGDNTGGGKSGPNPYINADGTPVVYARFDGIALPLPNDVAWGDNHGVCADGQVCLPLGPGETPGDNGMGTLKTIVNGLALPGLSPNMFLTIPAHRPVDIDPSPACFPARPGQKLLALQTAALQGGDVVTPYLALDRVPRRISSSRRRLLPQARVSSSFCPKFLLPLDSDMRPLFSLRLSTKTATGCSRP